MTSEPTSGVLSAEAERAMQAQVTRFVREAIPKLEAYANTCQILATLARQLISNLNTGRASYGDLVELCTAHQNIERHKENFAAAMLMVQRSMRITREVDESSLLKAIEASGVGAIQALNALKGEK